MSTRPRSPSALGGGLSYREPCIRLRTLRLASTASSSGPRTDPAARRLTRLHQRATADCRAARGEANGQTEGDATGTERSQAGRNAPRMPVRDLIPDNLRHFRITPDERTKALVKNVPYGASIVGRLLISDSAFLQEVTLDLAWAAVATSTVGFIIAAAVVVWIVIESLLPLELSLLWRLSQPSLPAGPVLPRLRWSEAAAVAEPFRLRCTRAATLHFPQDTDLRAGPGQGSGGAGGSADRAAVINGNFSVTK